MPGGDWMVSSGDRFGRPNVRVQFVTDDNAVVLLHYTLVERTDAFKKAATEGGITDGKDQYMRMVMHFDTAAEKYCSLNESLFVAEGRLAGDKEIEYRIYRVV